VVFWRDQQAASFYCARARTAFGKISQPEQGFAMRPPPPAHARTLTRSFRRLHLLLIPDRAPAARVCCLREFTGFRRRHFLSPRARKARDALPICVHARRSLCLSTHELAARPCVGPRSRVQHTASRENGDVARIKGAATISHDVKSHMCRAASKYGT
jgi:hypothetical protein